MFSTFLANLFNVNQTDTHKIFLVESEDFFWHESKNFFLLFFFLVEQVEKESEGLKIEWFEPVVSTESVENLFLPFFFPLGMLTLLPCKGSSALLP